MWEHSFWYVRWWHLFSHCLFSSPHIKKNYNLPTTEALSVYASSTLNFHLLQLHCSTNFFFAFSPIYNSQEVFDLQMIKIKCMISYCRAILYTSNFMGLQYNCRKMLTFILLQIVVLVRVSQGANLQPTSKHRLYTLYLATNSEAHVCKHACSNCHRSKFS